MSAAAPPPLTYPTLYTFRVVLQGMPKAAEHVRSLVESVIGALSDESVSERPSRGGNYVAVHVSCLLVSEEQRREVYGKLKTIPGVLLAL